MPQVDISNLPGSSIEFFWSIYNSQLAIFPKIGSGKTVTLIGRTVPDPYVDADLEKTLINIVSDSSTEVQTVDDRILEIVKYAVAEKVSEFVRDFDAADRFHGRKRELIHEMPKHWENGQNFTETEGYMRRFHD